MSQSDKELVIAILKSIERLLEQKENGEALEYVGNIIQDLTK